MTSNLARHCFGMFFALLLIGPAAGATDRPAAPIVALHSPVNPHRNPDGGLKRSAKNQVVTGNWSGFEVANFQTGQLYSSADATWQVPTVSYGASTSSSTVEYSSIWLGIGGYCENSGCTTVDQTLIQLGTEQEASSSGGTMYYAWYELLPQSEVEIPHPVRPGDIMTASIVCVASCSPGTTQTWTLTMSDTTAGWSWTQNFSYKTTMLSAEWIVEAPYGGGILPLADYGQATFDASAVNNFAPTLSLSTNSIVMEDPWGQTSNPSTPSSSWFSTCWGSGSLAPCTTGAFGSAPAGAATATLAASPSSISSGQSSTLSWSSTNATSCTGAGFAAAGVSGSAIVAPTATSIYSVTCSGSGGPATASTTVTVAASSGGNKGKHHN
jgi:hypothetical protein